jgi:tetratricopeptide (TPR) repeat protein
MKVAYRLRRRPGAGPATALLLPSDRAADLARLCALLGHDPLPRVYRVADGFLLKLARPAAEAALGVVRLRALAENLLLPADAELEPALLPDEAAALASRRGLVFLPGGRVLEYAPAEPLAPAAWLAAAGLRRGTWQPLPEPPPLAERLTAIDLDVPGDSPEEVLQAGGEGIGTEEPRPADTGAARRMVGKAAFQAGKGLSWLGKALGLGGLAAAGARWMADALKKAPRLSEAVLGRHEASLRELLKDFREGNVERALRRALPLGGNDRGAAPYAGSRLPTNDTRYSLHNLLGSAGPAGFWLSPADVYRELEREYRRLAEQATRAGDYRRAAFIYGKLLCDYRMAAAVLARGGLHRDAAVLYESKVGDTLAAAREYEAAGDVDRALRLYRQRGEHALAGDLLRRAGDEEQALAEYQLAAEGLLRSGQGHYQAGELMRTRAGRPDLALAYYEAGWQRPGGDAIPCALRLAQHYADEGSGARLLTLVDEAGPYLEHRGNDGPAAGFYNEVAALADRPGLANVRDDLRDRALLALAGRLRGQAGHGASPGALVSTLLGASSVWAPAVVSDAQHAVRHAAGRPAPAPTAGPAAAAVRARVAQVTAVCQAPHTGDIFLGFASGEVSCFRPATGDVLALWGQDAPVLSLAASNGGEVVAVLRGSDGGQVSLTGLARSEHYQRTSSYILKAEAEPWLCPLLAGDGDDLLLSLCDGWEMAFRRGASLLPVARTLLADGDPLPRGALLFRGLGTTPDVASLLALDDHGVVSYSCDFRTPSLVTLHGRTLLRWCPRLPAGSTLARPPLVWLRRGLDLLELAGVSAEGDRVCWSSLEFHGGDIVEVASDTGPAGGPYLAVCLVRTGLIAAVTPKLMYWLRRGPRGFYQVATDFVSLPRAVACFPHYRGNELIVVSGDGAVARVAPLRS